MLACATSSASTSAARTSSLAPCPRTGAASSPCTRQTTHAEQGADAVVDRIAKMVDAVITQVTHREKAKKARFSRRRRRRAGPARSRARHGRRGAESRMARLPAARLDRRAASTSRSTLDNDANCATIGEWWKGAAQRREECRRDHDRHRHRRRHHHRTACSITARRMWRAKSATRPSIPRGATAAAATMDVSRRTRPGPRSRLRAREALERDEARCCRRMVDGASRRAQRRHDLRRGERGRRARARGRARHRAVPRHRHREPAQHLQSGCRRRSPAA